MYPFRIRRDPKKNIRIWQSDGVEDIENQFGSWPLQAVQFANSLKMKGYDYHFRLGEAAHNGSQASLDLPESLAWLWRDYDPAKTEQVYEQDPAEKDKPLYRIKLAESRRLVERLIERLRRRGATLRGTRLFGRAYHRIRIVWQIGFAAEETPDPPQKIADGGLLHGSPSFRHHTSGCTRYSLASSTTSTALGTATRAPAIPASSLPIKSAMTTTAEESCTCDFMILGVRNAFSTCW